MSDHIGFTLSVGADLVGIDLADLWWRYAAMGGTSTRFALAQQVMGITPCAPDEHDLIAQALNEAFLDQGIDSFPVAYADPAPRPVSRPDRSIWVGAPGRSVQIRHDAAVARLRSAAAARRAAALQATAAKLMEGSGQLQFALQARARSLVAQQRCAALTSA